MPCKKKTDCATKNAECKVDKSAAGGGNAKATGKVKKQTVCVPPKAKTPKVSESGASSATSSTNSSGDDLSAESGDGNGESSEGTEASADGDGPQ